MILSRGVCFSFITVLVPGRFSPGFFSFDYAPFAPGLNQAFV
jgi:hypothetical protein